MHSADACKILERSLPGLRGRDSFRETCAHWMVEKFDVDLSPVDLAIAIQRGLKPFEIVEGSGNLLMTNGANDLWSGLVTAGLSTPYNSTNGAIGAGDGAGVAGAGTATFTNASATVTGSGTSFNTLFSVGDYIANTADGQGGTYYTVSVIGSATSITLSGNYLGTTGSGVAYYRIPKEVASATDLAASVNKYRQQVSGAPTVSTNTCAFVASFTGANGNYAWNEWGVFNSGTSQSGSHMLNRKVSSLGVKAANSTWQFTVTLSLA